jgi:hypothetical protein
LVLAFPARGVAAVVADLALASDEEEKPTVPAEPLPLARKAATSDRTALAPSDGRDDIAEFVYEKLRCRPLVLPVVVEV